MQASPGSMTSPIQERESLGELETATCASHGSYGPPERLNRLKYTCTPGTDLRTHHAATQRKHKLRRATYRSADPRIGRTDLGSVGPGLPRAGSWLAPGRRCLGL
jgi:hypothetical protein